MSEAEILASQAAAAAVQVETSAIPPASPNAAGNDLGGGSSSTEAMSLSQLMVYLTQQNQMMANLVQMIQHDRFQAKDRFANAKLDERNFRSVGKFNNRRDGWRDWKLHFMAAVRECDTSVADFVWGHEKLEVEVDIMGSDLT